MLYEVITEIIPVRAAFNDIYSSEIKEKVLGNWAEYGLDKVV